MHGFKTETYRRVVECKQGVWPLWAEYPMCLTCLVRFVWTLFDLSRVWLAKTLSPDPGSSHFLCACNLSIKISDPEDISSLGNEWHPHRWKCVCSAEEVNISVTGLIQVIFLKSSLYNPFQQVYRQDGQYAWRQPQADPRSVGGAGRQAPDIRHWGTEQSPCSLV